MSAGTGRAGVQHRGLRLIGVVLWLGLLVGATLLAAATGVNAPGLALLIAAALTATGVVGLVAYARLASAPPPLRTLRILAMLLPSLFIVCIEAVLLVIEADEVFSEVGEHIFATAILSLAAIPFSIWIFRSFATLHEQLAAQAQLLATVEERERIARDLHDDLGQLLGFLTTKVQAARELASTGRSEQAVDELDDLEGATRALSAQVRESILGLRASAGSDRPLDRALEEYAAEFGIQARLHVAFTAERGAGESLPGPARYQMLRIAQEAMSNARRHAGAGSITVELHERDGQLLLDVHDDGAGFDPHAASATGRFGLKTMAERARAIGGTLRIDTAPEHGTTIHAAVPLIGTGEG